MKYSNSFYVRWTDGGNPAAEGYFDGAASMNNLLKCLFAGRDCYESIKIPFNASVMDDIVYGTRLKITVSIETEED